MSSQFPTIQPHSGRLRPRHLLTGLTLAATLTLSLGGGRGSAQQDAAAQIAAPATGHAQVIAQAVLDLEGGASLAWTVAVTATLFAPILVLAMVLLEGMHIQLPPRYGASVLPGFLLAIGMLMTSKVARGLVLGYGLLLLVYVCVFAGRYA